MTRRQHLYTEHVPTTGLLADASLLNEATEVAVQAAHAAASLSRTAFGQVHSAVAKVHPSDLVTAIDLDAEVVILETLRGAFPNHHIVAEERGHYGPDSDWVWIVDPLDGTSNYALGLPLYGVTLALLHKQATVLSLIATPHTGDVIVTVRDRGAKMLDVKRGQFTDLPQAPTAPDIVALQQGYQVARDSRELANLRNRLEGSYSRVLYTWAPSVDALLLLKHEIAGVVGFDCLGYERAAWLFAAKEAGLIVLDPGTSDELAAPQRYVVAWPQAVHRLLAATEWS